MSEWQCTRCGSKMFAYTCKPCAERIMKEQNSDTALIKAMYDLISELLVKDKDGAWIIDDTNCWHEDYDHTLYVNISNIDQLKAEAERRIG